MDLKEIAEALVAGCRAGDETANLSKLYAPDVVSVEAVDNGGGREARGLDALRAKHAWWHENMEVSSAQVSDPMLHGPDRFAVIFEVDGTEKATGKAFEMREVGLYHVANGRIVREEFFYGS